MKRKISTLALAALTAVSLSSCGGSSSVPVTAMEPEEVEKKYSDRIDGSIDYLAKVSNAKDFIGIEASLMASSKVETYTSDKVTATQTTENKLTFKANLDALVLNADLTNADSTINDRSAYYTEINQVIKNSVDSTQNVNGVMKMYYSNGVQTVINGTDVKTSTAEEKLGLTLAPVFQGLKAILNDTTTTAKEKLETIISSFITVVQGETSVVDETVSGSTNLTEQITGWVNAIMTYATETTPTAEIEDAAVASVLEIVETLMKLEAGTLDSLKTSSKTDILAVVKKAVAFVTTDLSKTIDLLAGSSGKRDAIKVQLNTTKLTTAIGTLIKNCETQLVNIITNVEKVLEPTAQVEESAVKTLLSGLTTTIGATLSNIGEVSASVFFNEKMISGFAIKMEVTIPTQENGRMVTSSEINGDFKLSDSAVSVPTYSAK